MKQQISMKVLFLNLCLWGETLGNPEQVQREVIIQNFDFCLPFLGCHLLYHLQNVNIL